MTTIKQETHRQAAGSSRALAPLSTIASAIALLAATGGSALAANECGPSAAQLLCTGNTYSGISYIVPTASGTTLTLDNPNMVVTGSGVSLKQNSSAVVADTLIHVANVGSITAPTLAVDASGLRPGTLVGVTIDGGNLTSTADSSNVVRAFASNGPSALVTVNGGVITNAGTTFGSAVASQVALPSGTLGDASVVINGGVVQALGTGSAGVINQVSGANATGTALVTVNGGSVSGQLQGIRSTNTGRGLAAVQMSGGSVSAAGPNSDGLFVLATTNGSFRADLNGGTVTGGSGFGAALHTSARNGGVINVGAGAVLNAGPSGVAIRNGDQNTDGVDEIAGNVAMTLGGTINGSVLMGAGTDTLTITGGSINGNLVADANDALTFDTGANRFVYGSAYSITDFGSITMKSGDVRVDGVLTGGTLTVNGGSLELSSTANAYTGGTFLNGGVLSISSDANLGRTGTTVTFDGGTLRGTAALSARRDMVLNAGGGTFQADAPMAVTGTVSGIGGLTKTGGSTLTLSAVNGYTGTTTISSGTLALTGAGAIANSTRVVADGGFDISGISATGTPIQSLAGGGTVALGDRALTLSHAGDTFGGVISGTGALVIGGGTEVLTGTNTYTGGTSIQSGGTLQLGTGGTTGVIVGDVANRGALIIHRSDNVTMAGVFTGDGTIRQIGAGLTRFTADSTGFTGTTRVEAGTLAVDGTLGGSMQVLAGARLQGNGTVGPLSVAGTVAPGNSIGTLHVAGDFSQAAGSVYQVEVDPITTKSDQLLISGKATLAQGAQLQVTRTEATSYRLNTRYTVLTATGGLTGTYQLTGDTQSAFVKLVDVYDANNVYLMAEKVRSFTDVAQTPNQHAVGGALDQATGSDDMLTAIGWLPDEASARDAFDQLSGEIHASLKTALIEDTRFVREAALSRLRVDDCGASLSRTTVTTSPDGACVDGKRGFDTWGQVYGATGSLDTDGNAHRLKRHLSGFLLGADRSLGKGWRVGGLAGYHRADVDVRADDARVGQFHLGGYAGWQSGPNALRFGASHTWASADVKREVRFSGFVDALSSRQDSRLLQVFGEAARRVDAGKLAMEPFAQLAYVLLHSDALAEQGGLAALRASSGNDSVGFATAGLRLSREVNARTRLQAQFGWRRAFGDTTPTRAMRFADQTGFDVRGLPIARDAATLELGAETQWRPGATLSLVYSGQYAGALEDHSFRLRASWMF